MCSTVSVVRLIARGPKSFSGAVVGACHVFFRKSLHIRGTTLEDVFCCHMGPLPQGLSDVCPIPSTFCVNVVPESIMNGPQPKNDDKWVVFRAEMVVSVIWQASLVLHLSIIFLMCFDELFTSL
jgi:hypothetical protein